MSGPARPAEVGEALRERIIGRMQGHFDKETDQYLVRVVTEECAALAPRVTPDGGWRPIESAKKGRKLIVGWVNPLGNWRSVMGRYYETGTLASDDEVADTEGYAPEGWYEESETQDTLLPIAPTHWHEPPAPPAPAKTADSEGQARRPFKMHVSRERLREIIESSPDDEECEVRPSPAASTEEPSR